MPRYAGNCNKICPCTRCDGSGTPYQITVMMDAVDYVLPKWESTDTVENCSWRLGFSDPEDFGTGEEFQFLLTLGETVSEAFWLLLVWNPDDEEVYQYSFSFPGLPTVDCTASQTLTETTVGGAGTVAIDPDNVRGACCPCDEAPSIGSGLLGVCSACRDNIAAEQYQVVLSGISEDPSSPICGLCADYNGTYILSRALCVNDESGCCWRSDPFDDPCYPGIANLRKVVQLQIIPPVPAFPNRIAIRVRIINLVAASGPAQWITYVEEYPNFDCLFDGYEVDPDDSRSQCLIGTCVVDAL